MHKIVVTFGIAAVAAAGLVSGQVPAAGRRNQTNGPVPISVRLGDSKRIRTAAAGLLGWKVGISSASFRQTGFLEAAGKADLLGVSYIEGYSNQKVSQDLAKNLDLNLSAEEIAAVRNRLAELRIRVAAYHADHVGSDESSRRKLFDFAKALGAETIIAPVDAASLAAIDQLAGDAGINVAIAGGDLKTLLSSLGGRSKRIGVAIDTGAVLQEGGKPLEVLSSAKERVLAVYVRDRSAAGASGRDVTLGTGAAGLTEFFREAAKLELKPLFVGVQSTGIGETFPDLARSLQSSERVLQPAMGYRVIQISQATPITSPEKVTPEERQKIEAALPRKAQAKPRKPRKLLVMDMCPAGGYTHTSIPHANLALELMGKFTGAYEPTFSNDLNNLKYENLRKYDAVFLNNTVGEIFPDPEVREGLLRYVREGGGVAGLHGASYASMNLPDYSDLLGAADGPHRIEPGVLKIEDPNSPINAGFGGKEFFEYTDEYYRFLADGPYSRDKLHILLSLDPGRSDITKGRPPYIRPDNDYGLSWIKTYGKGRVFNCALGHTHTLFMTTPLAEHVLAGIQFVLGDLDADTTPSSRPAAKKK